MIDTSNWKKFKISDLFDVVLAKGDIKPNEVPTGNIPFVSAGKNNNGVAAYVSENGDGISEIFTGNKITIDMFGKSFYQERDFFAASHGRVNILIPKFNMTKMTGLFVCAIIDKHQNDFSYSNACYSKQAREMIIILPTTSDGSPDWQYMESYMRNLWDKIEITFKKENNNNRIDTSNWKKFKISDLFEVQNGNYTPLTNLIEDPNGINMISVTNFNNGIVGRYKKIPSMKIYSAKKLTWGKQAPHLFYQKEEFATNQSVYMLDVSNISMMSALFVASVVNKIVCPKYDYANNLIGSRMAEEIIPLPTTSDGSPDWQYMEDFMRGASNKCIITINGKVIE